MPRFQPRLIAPSKLLGLSTSLVASSVRGLSSSSAAAGDMLWSYLKDPTLTEWPEDPSAPGSSERFPVTDPSSPSTILAEVPTRDPVAAIDRCAEALPSWRDTTTASHRASLLSEWSRLMGEHSDDLATIMTLESGKPLAESKGEVNYARSFLDFYAAEAVRPTGAGGGFMVP
eukprot:CAMPEP_0172373886 /NCGR_PEP_ID=MMETSP1060-20121228/53618_1 /TAXON_ID=37318 /ORGANISM="Pseudo-nitzschia pungens, Strain cf. cingulata" /LENGTH=172 /DNA_ID=CAMNT_0013100359 /DNA_START=69 /DNA_END=584 /DNA_ORIENTATION=+